MAKANEADVDKVRERRYVLKDMLNTNLLSPEARKQFEKRIRRHRPRIAGSRPDPCPRRGQMAITDFSTTAELLTYMRSDATGVNAVLSTCCNSGPQHAIRQGHKSQHLWKASDHAGDGKLVALRSPTGDNARWHGRDLPGRSGRRCRTSGASYRHHHEP